LAKKRVILATKQESDQADQEELFSKLDPDWEITEVSDGTKAIAAMKESDIDAVICISELDDMPSHELLKKIRDLHPETVRFLLSAKSDAGTQIISLPYVHQMIPADCKPEVLKAMLDNSVRLRGLLADEGLRQRVSRISSLPVLPEIYNELTAELNKENSSLNKVAGIISRDIGITTKLLSMVNSVFFGLRQRVENVEQTINLIGYEIVKNIVLSAGLFNQFPEQEVSGYSVRSIYENSMFVGAKARLIGNTFGMSKRVTEESLLAGMLYDVGKLMMITTFKPEFEAAAKLSKEQSISPFQAQQKLLGASDASLGAYLLSLWGLPDQIVEAVAYHYTPHEIPSPTINAVTAVHLAFATDYDESANIRDEKLSVIDMEYLKSLGLANQLAGIRGLCLGAVV